MKTLFPTTATCSLLLYLAIATVAQAIKIEIPKQYEAQLESLRAEEAALVQERLARGVESERTSKTTATSMVIEGVVNESQAAESREDGAAQHFLLESVEEATTTAEAFTGELPADHGLVSGQVVDKETGAPVVGAAIILEGTDMGTITDAQGRYSIGPAPAGMYTLSFIKSGYIEANVTEFAVKADEVSVFPFAMPPRPAEMSDEVYELQDFTVTAEEANDLMMKLDIRMNSDAILNVMSSEDFSKYAASDVGDAIKRISGVTVQGGQFAVIRGLDERYSSTTFNGAPVPSPDPDRQSVPLDLFSSDIVSNLTISKTFEANLPGNSAGGSIGIWTNVFPEEFTVKLSAKVDFNDNAAKDFLAVDKSKSHVNFHSSGEYNIQNSEIADLRGDKLTPTEKSPALDINYGLEIGGPLQLGAREIRFLGNYSSKSKSRTTLGSEEQRYALPARNRNSTPAPFSSPGVLDRPDRRVEASGDFALETLSYTKGVYDKQVSTAEIQDNVLFAVEGDLDARGEHVLGGTYFKTTKQTEIANALTNGRFPEAEGLSESELIGRGGYMVANTPVTSQFLQDARDETGFSVSELVRDGRFITTTVAQVERELEVMQINGSHVFESSRFLSGLEIDWGLSRAETRQTESDVVSLSALELPDGTYFAQVGTDSGDQFIPKVSWRNIEEEQDFGRIDFAYDFEFSDWLSLRPEFGYAKEDTYRGTTLITYDLALSPSTVFTSDLGQTYQNGLTGQTVGNVDPVTTAEGRRGNESFYFATKATFWDQFDVVAGMRIEDFLMSSTTSSEGEFFNSDVLISTVAGNPNSVFNAQLLGINGGEPLSADFQGSIEQTDYLPSVSVSYRPMEGMRATLAASQTNVRPSFKDFTYVPSRDPLDLDYFIGNPALETSDVYSYDFRIEYAWGAGDLVSFGVFYKTIKNPVERTTVRGSQATTDIMYNNPEDGIVQGLEFEFRKNLGFIDEGLLSRFSIGGNLTLIVGEATVLQSIQDIFSGGFVYTDANGGEQIAEGGYFVLDDLDSSTGQVEVLKPYDTRPLYQQPEWIANADITFYDESWGTRATLSLFAQSDVLETAEGYLLDQGVATPSVFRKSFYELNFTLSQQFRGRFDGLSLTFEVKNLTDSIRGTRYDDAAGGGDRSEYTVGRSYGFSASYTF
ncbi:MAG: TonB-dependent receptor domain-containing protein [Opitutaceae bacterium]